MCGITGILNCNNAKPPDNDEIRRMTAALVHRGPDGWGTYLSPAAALGHTRLSIIDLCGGHQPLTTEKFVISYNGEIYNYIEIRQDLLKCGIRFSTSSDTEVILRAFEVYGFQAFSLLNGQFAVLIWDKINKRMIAARDRYGIRPLYVLEHGSRYYFTSEMKAFDSIDNFKRQFHPKYLSQRALFWNTLGDHTVFDCIRCVPAGCYEIYNTDRSWSRHRYYQIGESEQLPCISLEDAIDEFDHLLKDSVRLRLRSDVPVVTYLSGGIDSSVISYLTSMLMGNKLKTFSISFKDKTYDESRYQEEMAAFLCSDHHNIVIDYKDINDYFVEAAYHFEQPVFRTAEVPLYLLSKAVRSKGIKVVLTGEGADEVLCGYDSFKEIKLLNFWGKHPDSRIRPLLIKRLYPHLAHYQNSKQYGLMRMYYEGFLDGSSRELECLSIRVHNNSVIENYLSEGYRYKHSKEELRSDIRETLPDNYQTWSILQKNQFLEMKTLLEGYLLSSQGDRMSLAHGVEGRYPFLDHRVVERGFYLKDNFKLNGFNEKTLLKRCYGDLIPESIIKRPKKPYTSPDLQSFLHKGKLSDTVKDMLSPDMLKDYGLFDPTSVQRFLNKVERFAGRDIGYRDNMLITYILSCQMINYWIENPKNNLLDEKLKTVELYES